VEVTEMPLIALLPVRVLMMELPVTLTGLRRIVPAAILFANAPPERLMVPPAVNRVPPRA